MNQCILMAEVIQAPQLRHTQDNLAVAEMVVQFEGAKPTDPPSRLKVVGWGNLAQMVQESCGEGDRVILEGRLRMGTQERDGYKEKIAELTLSRLHRLSGGDLISAMPPVAAPGMAPSPAPGPARPAPTTVSPSQTYRATPVAAGDLDEIPF